MCNFFISLLAKKITNVVNKLIKNYNILYFLNILLDFKNQV